MTEIDPITGLPKDLGVWENIAKEQQEIVVRTEKRKFGKIETIIEGIDSKDIDIKDLGKQLKSKFACGGTVKNGTIELQGNHASKVKDYLIDMGFAAGTITIKQSR